MFSVQKYDFVDSRVYYALALGRRIAQLDGKVTANQLQLLVAEYAHHISVLYVRCRL